MSKLVKFDKKYATKRDIVIPAVNRDLKEVVACCCHKKNLGRGSQLCLSYSPLNYFEGVLRFPKDCLFVSFTVKLVLHYKINFKKTRIKFYRQCNSTVIETQS